MSGKTLKQQLKDMGYENISELARAMGVGIVNLRKAFEVKDVKTGLLEDIANALGLSVADFYPRVTNNADNGIAVSGDGNTNTVNNTISEQLVKSMLDKKDEHIARLLAIIEQMSKQ